MNPFCNATYSPSSMLVLHAGVRTEWLVGSAQQLRCASSISISLSLSLSLGLGSVNLEKNLPKISLARGAVLGLLRRRACMCVVCDMRHAAGALANRREMTR